MGAFIQPDESFIGIGQWRRSAAQLTQCPLRGLAENPFRFDSAPTPSHRCLAGQTGAPIRLDYQAAVCLTSECRLCPHRDGSSRPPAPRRTGPWAELALRDRLLTHLDRPTSGAIEQGSRIAARLPKRVRSPAGRLMAVVAVALLVVVLLVVLAPPW